MHNFFIMKFGGEKFIYYLCNCKQETNKNFMIMKTMYLIEHYAINRKNGVWSLTSFSRVDYHEKNIVMKSVKKQGFQYDRSEKAYILKTDPVEFCADKAVTVKSYTI